MISNLCKTFRLDLKLASVATLYSIPPFDDNDEDASSNFTTTGTQNWISSWSVAAATSFLP